MAEESTRAIDDAIMAAFSARPMDTTEAQDFIKAARAYAKEHDMHLTDIGHEMYERRLRWTGTALVWAEAHPDDIPF